MQYQIYISETAEKNLENIFLYLQKEWSEKVKNDFKSKFLHYLDLIKKDPFIFPSSSIKKEIRKCIITKHNAMYYRVSGNIIEIITIQDTRQNPDNLKLK